MDDGDDDYKTAEQNAQFRRDRDALIQDLIKGGASPAEAQQLFQDMQNDPYNADPDIVGFMDPTINARLEKWSKKPKT